MAPQAIEPVVYQGKDGAIEFRIDARAETVWASLEQIASIFGRDKSVISRHLSKIFSEGELDRSSTVAKNATAQKEGGRTVVRDIDYYNLDVILSVGYRVNSKTATKFRQWATKTLRQYVSEGYAVNVSRIESNYEAFLKAVEDVKKCLPVGSGMGSDETLDLVRLFASTWFSLDAYDRSNLPESGWNRTQVELAASDLASAIAELKADLLSKGEATELFAQEKIVGNLAGIVGNVMQSVFGEDAYPTLEEKATHLLYFIIKNHPFNDGNKRSGAFAFVWFLRKAGILDATRMSPEALTALALLIAESDPKEKSRVIGLVLILLRKDAGDSGK
ncbi:MAG: hypothetical protein QG650_33 [Patescibacteria group bacterium]|nr:hypothetical protein [Patescibacteria group bacterium]